MVESMDGFVLKLGHATSAIQKNGYLHRKAPPPGHLANFATHSYLGGSFFGVWRIG